MTPLRHPGGRAIDRGCRGRSAFTLIEVAVASAIMALALFGFISVCSTALKSAKSLNRVEVDASSLAAELSISNRLEEMSDHGDFGGSTRATNGAARSTRWAPTASSGPTSW